MAFKLKSQGAAFKMMGSSPARKVGGNNEKKSIGPIKPMTDKDNDGIPVGVDRKDTPGGRQSTPPKKSRVKDTEKRKDPPGGRPRKPVTNQRVETTKPVTKKKKTTKPVTKKNKTTKPVTKGDVIQTLVAPHANVLKTFNVTKHYTKEAVKGGKKVYRKVKNYLKSEA